jgi:site-specific DNA recombinase
MLKTIKSATKQKVVRVGIYCRVSSEEGLNQEFTSLDNQEQRSRDRVASRSDDGWMVAKVYRDGGYSGGTINRPGLQELLLDVQAGKLDVIVIHKLDRISRRLLDFYRLMELLDTHNVSLVSVTQSLDTSDATGRLMVSILMSFAQFELELTSERIRDKTYSTRKLGKRTGGRPILGYDIDPITKQFVVNEAEAEIVRSIYSSFIADPRVATLSRALNAEGVRQKTWTMRNGEQHVVRDITPFYLHRLLRNKTYLGLVEHHPTGEVFKGQHQAMIDQDTWDKTQVLLQRDRHIRQSNERSQIQALLKHLVYCRSCGCRMRPKYTAKSNKRYYVYLCNNAQRNGYHACPMPSTPAAELEKVVLDQLRLILRSDEVQAGVLRAVRVETERQRELVIGRIHELEKELAEVQAIGELEETVPISNELAELRTELHLLTGQVVSEAEVSMQLSGLDAIWENMFPATQARLVQLLVARVEVEPDMVRVHLHETAIASLTRLLLTDENTAQEHLSAGRSMA